MIEVKVESLLDKASLLGGTKDMTSSGFSGDLEIGGTTTEADSRRSTVWDEDEDY